MIDPTADPDRRNRQGRLTVTDEERYHWCVRNREAFISIIESEFPADRLTWQKGIPTFHPETAEEAARLVKFANQHARTLFITGFGNNIDPIGERFANIISIRTDRLNKLHEIARLDFYIRTGAGYPMQEINLHLEKHGLFFPHSALPYVGSVGGAVAVNLAANLHGVHVPIKKYLIKAEIVTPEGDIITPGSICFKSVSGYDVVKIFSPSWGLLGLIVSATFRVMPLSGAADFTAMRMQAVDRARFLAGLDESNQDCDAVYSRKIKNKFDPVRVLPIV
jgi:FAD/FMN-containing dehydrogenase